MYIIITSKHYKHLLVQLDRKMCFKYTKRFLGLLHEAATFTNFEIFPLTLHESRVSDKRKAVIIPYFLEKSEKNSLKMWYFLRFSQSLNLTFRSVL